MSTHHSEELLKSVAALSKSGASYSMISHAIFNTKGVILSRSAVAGILHRHRKKEAEGAE